MRNQRKLWLRRAAFLIIVSALGAGTSLSAATQTKGPGAAKGSTSKASPRRAPVVKLQKIDRLKEAFQRDSGKVRLVTILSPT